MIECATHAICDQCGKTSDYCLPSEDLEIVASGWRLESPYNRPEDSEDLCPQCYADQRHGSTRPDNVN